jgi:PhnB protein
MLAEASEENPDPNSLGGTPAVVFLYVGDAEGVFNAALDAGCEVVYPLKEQFYGDKSGRVKDPFGHHWIIARHVEDVPPEEMQRRWHKLFS